MSISSETKNVDVETNFAHGEGFTYVYYHKNGRSLITGGSDGEVRHWIPDDLDHETESFTIGSSIYSLAIKDDVFYVGSDSIDLKEYKLTDGSYNGSKARFTGDVYCIDLSADGKYLSAGSGDFNIKLLNLEDSSLMTISEHKAPVLSTAIHPNRQLIASSSCDGTVIIYDFKEISVLKRISTHEKSNDFLNSSTLCRICWDRSGERLLVPSINGVIGHDLSDWDRKTVFKADRFNATICQTSINDRYLACGNNDGLVLIFNYSKPNYAPVAVLVGEKSSKITSICWNPMDQTKFAITDEKGELHLATVHLDGAKKPSKTTGAANYNQMLTDVPLDDDDIMEDDGLDNVLSSQAFEEPKKAENIIENDQLSEDLNGDQLLNDLNDDRVEGSEDEFEPGEQNEIDIGAIKAAYEPIIFGNDAKKEEKSKFLAADDPMISSVITKVNNLKLPIIQPPFQPGSTPLEDLQRYMAWNSVGIIKSITNDDGESSINVEFHDIQVHHSIHLPNNDNYTMADLSDKALVLANRGDDDSLSSKLFCMTFNVWVNDREWKYDLPHDEFIDALALGAGFIAIATNRRNIRIFTLAGFQLYIFTIAGPAVCLIAQEQSLMVIHHHGSGLPGEQNLVMMVLKFDTKNILKKQQQITNPVPVAISPKSKLAWAGFSDEGTPVVYDTNGVVRLYKDFIGHFWLPICNTKLQNKSVSDNYFIIGVTEIEQKIRCIRCKGSRHPPISPRPAPVTLNFEIPVCDASTDKGKLEEQHLKLSISHSLLTSLSSGGFDVEFQLDLASKKMIETHIKLFALAVNNECESLAIEVAYLMSSRKSLEGAIKYSNQKGKATLAQKLSEILDEKFNSRITEDESIIDESIIHTPFTPVPSRNCSFNDISTGDCESALKPRPIHALSAKKDRDETPLRPKLINGTSGQKLIKYKKRNFVPSDDEDDRSSKKSKQ